MLPCFGREHYRLSVTDVCRWRGGDGTSMRFGVPAAMVNIAHFPEFNSPSDQGLKHGAYVATDVVRADFQVTGRTSPPRRINVEGCGPVTSHRNHIIFPG